MKKMLIPAVVVTAFLIAMNCYAFDLIKKGDKGDNVKEVQELLIEQGYLEGTADGSFGPKTEEAVIVFQKQSGLSETGVVDLDTYNALFGIDQSHQDDTVSETEQDNAEKGVPVDEFVSRYNEIIDFFNYADLNLYHIDRSSIEKGENFASVDSIETSVAIKDDYVGWMMVSWDDMESTEVLGELTAAIYAFDPTLSNSDAGIMVAELEAGVDCNTDKITYNCYPLGNTFTLIAKYNGFIDNTSETESEVTISNGIGVFRFSDRYGVFADSINDYINSSDDDFFYHMETISSSKVNAYKDGFSPDGIDGLDIVFDFGVNSDGNKIIIGYTLSIPDSLSEKEATIASQEMAALAYATCDSVHSVDDAFQVVNEITKGSSIGDDSNIEITFSKGDDCAVFRGEYIQDTSTTTTRNSSSSDSDGYGYDPSDPYYSAADHDGDGKLTDDEFQEAMGNAIDDIAAQMGIE